MHLNEPILLGNIFVSVNMELFCRINNKPRNALPVMLDCSQYGTSSFNQMSPVLKDRKLSIPLKVRLLKCFIWSVLLYGCESWTLSAALTRNIDATEMWFYRRMLRVSYAAHETNISVLQRMGQERQLLRTIKERQTRFTGHIIRKGELEDLILAGKVQGKKARGGQRLLFLNQVMENTGLTSPRTILDAARNRTLKIKTS